MRSLDTSPVGISREPARRSSSWLRRHRGSLTTVALVSASGLLLARGAAHVGPALSAVAHAHPAGLAIAMVLGASTYVAAAIALTAASGRRLALGRTTGIQLAAACANRIVPAGVGGMVTNAQYLEREGTPRSQAVAAIGLTSVASFLVHTVATVVVLLLFSSAGATLPFASLALPTWWPVAVVVAALAASVTLYAARGRRHAAAAALRSGWETVSSMRHDRRRFALLLLGTVGVTMGHALAFAAAVTACGVQVPLGGLLLVFLAGSAIGNAAPTPGGLGALETVLVAGLTGLGAASAPALAGVLTFRLITYWLPVLPGAIAFRTLVPRTLVDHRWTRRDTPAIRHAMTSA